LIEGAKQNYGNKDYAKLSEDQVSGLNEWFVTAKGKMDLFKQQAAKNAQYMRDFILHDYAGDRFGLDALYGSLFQFHFWPSRTAWSIGKSLPYSSGKINKFLQTRELLGKLHADAPEWYRYTVNTNEILGTDAENPVFIDFMNFLNPFGNMMADFDNPEKRVNWYSSLYDGIGKVPLGYPNIALGLITTLALKAKGEQEASALTMGRLLPVTNIVKGASAQLGVDEGKGVELDPLIRFTSEQGLFGENVIGPYETKRIINALSLMAAENPEIREQAMETARTRSGPLWEKAIAYSRQKDALGTELSLFTGVNARIRSKDDITVDQFWQDYIRLWSMSETMSGDEVRENLQLLHKQYPFAEIMMLGRRGGEERDEAYTYSVLGRIEPGKTDDAWNAMGFKYDMISEFYDNKGLPEHWTEEDKNVFMSGVLSLGAALAIPEDTTKDEWNAARKEYQDMLKEGR